jgi:hypothetical protein
MPTLNLMSYAYLVQTISGTAAQTDERLNGFAKRFPPAIDCLLKLPYWTGIDLSKPDDFNSWAQPAYVSAGHSFAALYQMFRAGFYLESLVVHRHLMEVLIQLRYFAHHRDKVKAHFVPIEFHGPQAPVPAALAAGLPRRQTVQFRQMFDFFAPGFYENDYRMASELSHGGIGTRLLRNDQSGAAMLGCQFNEQHAALVSNEATALLYGFLSSFPEAFPTWTAPTEAKPTYDQALNVLDEILRSQWNGFPESRDWLTRIALLTGWSVPPGTP